MANRTPDAHTSDPGGDRFGAHQDVIDLAGSAPVPVSGYRRADGSKGLRIGDAVVILADHDADALGRFLLFND